MSLIDPAYAALAGPPSFETCTRDLYPPALRLSIADVIALAGGISRAAQHLHARGILHGDLYAHNILWNPAGGCYLGDFGAATFYNLKDASLSSALQRLEVRAFGCLLEELLERGEWLAEQAGTQSALQKLQQSCANGTLYDRPSFEEIVHELERLKIY